MDHEAVKALGKDEAVKQSHLAHKDLSEPQFPD